MSNLQSHYSRDTSRHRMIAISDKPLAPQATLRQSPQLQCRFEDCRTIISERISRGEEGGMEQCLTRSAGRTRRSLFSLSKSG